MIAFDSPTRSMTVQLGGAVVTNEPQWIASWQDGDAGPVGTQFGTTSGATPVTVVPAPDTQAHGTRQLASFSLYNNDTAPITVTATYQDATGPSSHTLQQVTIQSGESLIYEQNSGWSGLDVFGNTKVASTSSDVSAASSQASSLAKQLPSVSSQASSMAALSPASVSSAASRGLLGSSQASSAHAAIGDEATASSTVSRVKSSFGW